MVIGTTLKCLDIQGGEQVTFTVAPDFTNDSMTMQQYSFSYYDIFSSTTEPLPNHSKHDYMVYENEGLAFIGYKREDLLAQC